MIIVLVTGGKRHDHYLSGVQVFDDIDKANTFCKSINATENHCKYWRYAEIISENIMYEVDTTDCYDGEFKYYEH